MSKTLVILLHTSVIVSAGDTYQSNIGIEEDLDLEDIDLTPVSFPKDGSEIIFDLETTGLGKFIVYANVLVTYHLLRVRYY